MIEQAVIKEQKENGFAYVTLNRPESLNTYNEALLSQLTAIMKEIDGDDRVRGVVLAGKGKHFSAGADVNWFKQLASASAAEKLAASRLSTGAMRALSEVSKPTICLVQNACMGGGVGYAAACDIVIASEDARFSITEVRVGITPAPILAQVINAIGVRQTRRYALTAETFGAEEAKRIGLVHQVCLVGELDKAAEPIIDALLKGAPKAISASKALIGEVAGTNMSDALAERLAGISAAGRDTDEGIEGFSAFLEKRPANWGKERGS